MLHTDKGGWLYVAVMPEAPTRVKIGRARDIETRLRELEMGAPFPLALHSATYHEDVVATEGMIHRKLASARVHGEWFDRADAGVDQFLASREHAV